MLFNYEGAKIPAWDLADSGLSTSYFDDYLDLFEVLWGFSFIELTLSLFDLLIF